MIKPRPRVRHVKTLGSVPPDVLTLVRRVWRPDRVNQVVSELDVVLLLVDQNGTQAPEYVEMLRSIDQARCPVGVIPISPDPELDRIWRLLGDEAISIDFCRSLFRLSDFPEANLPSAPPSLRRGLYDDPASVAEDLASADLLVLGGHSGPVDGGFGRELIFCSRHLHREGHPPIFSCFGSDRCFRQANYGRGATSVDGLLDPATLRVPLLVLDGCSTAPIPGSLFPYETSLLRSFMASQVRGGVLSHGIAASSISVLLVFLGMLGRGRTLGEAVQQANHQATQLQAPNSIEGYGAAPWIVIGNPEIRVIGLPIIDTVAEKCGDAIQIIIDEEEIPAATGAIICVAIEGIADSALDLVVDDRRWAHGTRHGDSHIYLWVSGREAPSGVRLAPERVCIALVPRGPDPTSVWRERSKWLRANRAWLARMAQVVADRGGDSGDLCSLIQFWDDVSGAVEQVAFAAAQHRISIIGPPLTQSTASLTELLEQLDQFTAITVAAAVPVSGARLSRLWSPPWISEGFTEIEEPCTCGCPIAGSVRRHPVLDLVRIVMTCPACGPIADVSASGPQQPAMVGIPRRFAVQGETVAWPIHRVCNRPVAGFACAVLLDSFRERSMLTDVQPIGPGSRTAVAMTIPQDWPIGLAPVVVVVTFGGEMSFLDFDIVVGSKRSQSIPPTRAGSQSSDGIGG